MNDTKGIGAVELMVLTTGQVFLIFGIMVGLMSFAIMMLIIECFYFYVLRKNLLLWGSKSSNDKGYSISNPISIGTIGEINERILDLKSPAQYIPGQQQ